MRMITTGRRGDNPSFDFLSVLEYLNANVAPPRSFHWPLKKW